MADIEINMSKLIQQCLSDIRVEVSDEFDRNFERQAFFSDKWKRRKYNSDEGRSILIHTGSLRKSIQSEISGDRIIFKSALPYANIHNEGGTIVVTRKMKGYFYYKYREATKGIKTNDISTEAAFYKAMFLKKIGSKIIIPRRQFIGRSPEIEKIITEIIQDNLQQYFNNNEFKINIK